MLLDKFNLKGKVALVTGASTGLGQAMAVGLAEAGADVVLVARRSLQETEKQIVACGRKALPINADLTTTGSIKMIIDRTLAEFGSIDILVNNAGTIRRSPALEYTEEDWDAVLDLNLKTVFFLSQAVAKTMVRKGKGKIINIASVLSFQGGVLVPAYAASKGAIASLTKALANEWARHGINVNAIAPGYMATDMTAPLQADPDRNRSILERIPAGRWGTPADLQGAIVFLASEASDYIHGHILCVDGGWLAR